MFFSISRTFSAPARRAVCGCEPTWKSYWDSFEWARDFPDTPVKNSPHESRLADLHYRGYSVINKPNASSPEVPDYNQIVELETESGAILIGYYTRFGDVRELLQKIDDRYVIMNAGDEMSFRFPEQPPPPAGWVRDYVFIGDGWIKDGDYNSTFSKTVLPLPYHAKQEYITLRANSKTSGFTNNILRTGRSITLVTSRLTVFKTP